VGCPDRLPDSDEVEKPRIYGNEGRFRTAVTRAINSGDDLLAQVEGVRKLMQALGDSPEAHAIGEAWVADFLAWFNRTGRTLHRYLREQLIGVPPGLRPPGLDDAPEVLPVFGAGLPPDTGKPRHVIHIDEGEEWLRHALEELRELQSVLTPPKRSASKRAREAPEPAPPADGSWFRPSWWKLGTAGSIASLVGVPLGIAAIVLAFVLR
jgi:hypothetical protein